jgi:hypothetical protein
MPSSASKDLPALTGAEPNLARVAIDKVNFGL